MDISRYKVYVRDTQISDEDLENLIKDVIYDIARDTKIFRRQFSFNVLPCVDMYNIKEIFNTQSHLDTSVTEVTYTHEYNEKDIVDLINLIQDTNDKSTECDFKDNNEESTTETKTYTALDESYLATLDLFYVDDRSIKYKVYSMLPDFFEQVNNDTFISNHDRLVVSFGSDYNLEIVADVNVLPDPNKISEEDLNRINTSIIAGIKYYVSDMYMNINNEQVSNILYQRYYSSKKQLVYNNPQFVSQFQKFGSKYNSWNK